ncbi:MULTISPECIES: ABC transporter ATP-binding protein [Streptomyces]|uniref:ABC transporter ATP-binding protein n=1 Tax=Streptomyces TaxID=1883 RepID=UPI001603031A|nr:ABC transporter ATP-binding protein [Streptomyces murinus]MBA9049615.1 hypothetical protein [Streptomyces murinus]
MPRWTGGWRNSQPLYAAGRTAEGRRASAPLGAFTALPTLRALRLGPGRYAPPRGGIRGGDVVRVPGDPRGPPLLRAAQHRRVHRSERGPPRGLGLVHSGHADVGAATTAALLFVGLFDPVSTLRVGVTLGAPVSEGRPEVSPGRPAEGIAVRGVRHRYGGGPDVLHGIDLDLRAGQRLPSSARPARASPRRRA